MPEENEYELARQENIRKNRALLEELELNKTAISIRRETPKKKPTSAQRKTPIKREIDPDTPRRTSSRLRGIAAESEEAKRKIKEEDAHVALYEAERFKRQRVAGDIKLEEVVVNGKGGNILGDIKPERYGRTFTDDDVEATTDKGLKEARKKLMGLEIHDRFEPNEIKITPERVYWMGFHPTETKQLLFAGDKVGNLGVYDASNPLPNPDYSEEDEEPEDTHKPNLSIFKIHARSISTFVFDHNTAESMYISSYDGTIRKLDIAAQKSTEVYVADDIEDYHNTAISAVELVEPNILWFSTLDGRIGRKDLRESGDGQFWEFHVKKIGGFSLHPRSPHLAATASLDRTMKLWDLRRLGKEFSGEPALVAEHESRLSVSSATWNSRGSVVTASYDDTVKVYKQPDAHTWDEDVALGNIEPDSVIKHNNQSGRWVTILRGQWQQAPKSGPQKFCISNMNRFVDLYSEDGQQLAQLSADSLTAVPAAAQFHPTMDWVAGGTASGKVCLWV